MGKFKRIIFILTALLLFLATPPKLTANAMANNAGGDGNQGGTASGVSGGASESKCGFRMYVVSEKVY